jgi:hypothetical protein
MAAPGDRPGLARGPGEGEPLDEGSPPIGSGTTRNPPVADAE